MDSDFQSQSGTFEILNFEFELWTESVENGLSLFLIWNKSGVGLRLP